MAAGSRPGCGPGGRGGWGRAVVLLSLPVLSLLALLGVQEQFAGGTDARLWGAAGGSRQRMATSQLFPSPPPFPQDHVRTEETPREELPVGTPGWLSR